jgi:hypothetical protein
MSKKKINLADRKRLSELQNHTKKTMAEVRREQVQSMVEMHMMPEGKLELAIEQMIADVVLDLRHSYEQWSQPLDKNRFCYSPNARNRKLLQLLKNFLNEIEDWLMSKGYRGSDCLEKCQEIVDKISDELRISGVAIGHLQLRVSNKGQH